MVSQTIRFLSQFPALLPPNCHRPFAFEFYAASKTRRRRWRWRSFSGGGSRWEWDEKVNPNKQSRFRDAYVNDDYDDEEVEFGFAKRRRWWSDEVDAGEDEDDDDDGGGGFGILEASIGFNWVRKVFQAFGWMIPAVVISMVLGTGQDSMIMALALPLLQSALSLAADAFWGRPEEPSRTKTKRKKRPSAGAPGRGRVRRERENRNQTRRATGDYKSWVDSDNVSAKTKTGPQDFGGWDELDNHVREGSSSNEREKCSE